MTSHDEAMRAELEQVRNKLRAYASTGRLSNRYAEVLRKSLNDMADVVDGCLAARAQAASGEVNQDQPNGYTIDEFISGVWSYSYTSETGQEMSGCAHWASYNLACLDAWGAYAESLEAKLKVQAASGDPVGPRHPEVIRWRNDAIESCAAIAERYREVGNCDEWVVVNIRALLTQPPAPSVSVEALEEVASQWDGCLYDLVGESIDIGLAIRDAFSRIAASKKV